jgi:hypothetical protein
MLKITEQNYSDTMDAVRAYRDDPSVRLEFLSANVTWVDVANPPLWSKNVFYRVKKSPTKMPLANSELGHLLSSGVVLRHVNGVLSGVVTHIKRSERTLPMEEVHHAFLCGRWWTSLGLLESWVYESNGEPVGMALKKFGVNS